MTAHETGASIPPDGVEFELTLDSTVDPLEMVKGDGCDPHEWKFTGFKVVPQTRSFKLVRVGYCEDLYKLCQKLAKHGSIPEGQWREAFKKAFPQNDGQGPIGFVDPSWVSPFGSVHFPVLIGRGEAWGSFFPWIGGVHGEDWRWLVEVAK